MNAVRIECPLSTCDWVTDATPPLVPEGTLADIFGPGVMAASSAFTHSMDVERRLREHFGTHKLEEWVAEITRLRKRLAEYEDAIAFSIPMEAEAREAPVMNPRRFRPLDWLLCRLSLRTCGRCREYRRVHGERW